MESLRCTGKTTRIVDAAIQELFNTGRVTIQDHVNHRDSHNRTMQRVCRRHKSEHHGIQYTINGYSIKLK